ncbi:MAG: sugar ABC transporter permease [Defluviitaleaceae bacterium]|nr:sugar ABC transporter permease [Defluviitaleaceae bacterium]MCL2239727.1 sugar ABC transporter permease [Defluviitaleaceae bacterium]
MTAIKRFIYKENVAGVIFALPFIIGFLAFLVVPMGMSLYYSFTRFNILRPPEWIGLENYTRMLTDERLRESLFATLYFVFAAVPLRLVVALAIAILLFKSTKMMGIYRAMYYLPSMLGGSVAVAILWRRLFFSTGTFNTILGVFGLNRNFNWIGDTRTAIWVLILLSAWQFGSAMLIFLASLKQIPETYYEAASIDGASSARRFFKITLPLITPTIFFNLMMQTIAGFLTFNSAFLITGGGPLNTTNFFALYMYNHTFAWGNAGYSSALAWFMLSVLALITGLLFGTRRFWVYDGGFS